MATEGVHDPRKEEPPVHMVPADFRFLTILTNDALLIFFHGAKSTSQKHDNAVHLLITMMKTEAARQQARHLNKLLHRKSLIEYTGERLRPAESAELCKHAQRFSTG